MLKPFLYVFAVLSITAMILYGVDKRRAKRGAWRIPEKLLLGIGFLGGALGALLGMYLFRHKTKHWYFTVVNLLGLAWQIVFLYFGYQNQFFS